MPMGLHLQWNNVIKIFEKGKNSLWCGNYLQVWAIFLHVDRSLTFFRLEACSPLVQILSYQLFLAAQFLQFFQIELLLRDQLYWPELIVPRVLRYLILQLHKPKNTNDLQFKYNTNMQKSNITYVLLRDRLIFVIVYLCSSSLLSKKT